VFRIDLKASLGMDLTNTMYSTTSSSKEIVAGFRRIYFTVHPHNLLCPYYEPLLWLMINDLVNDIQSTVQLFADDCLIYRLTHTPADHHILQKDLQKTRAKKLKMRMQLFKHHHKSEFTYSMSRQDLKDSRTAGAVIDHQLS